MVETYLSRKEDDKIYSHRVSMEELEDNECRLNISRYVSTAKEEAIDSTEVQYNLDTIEDTMMVVKKEAIDFLKKLGLLEMGNY